MEERKYALTRVTSGDYIVPSNDGATLWRISRYTEDGSLSRWETNERGEAVGKGKVVLGQFWMISTYIDPLRRQPENLPDDFLDWSYWTTWESLLPSRGEALNAIPWQRQKKVSLPRHSLL